MTEEVTKKEENEEKAVAKDAGEKLKFSEIIIPMARTGNLAECKIGVNGAIRSFPRGKRIKVNQFQRAALDNSGVDYEVAGKKGSPSGEAGGGEGSKSPADLLELDADLKEATVKVLKEIATKEKVTFEGDNNKGAIQQKIQAARNAKAAK